MGAITFAIGSAVSLFNVAVPMIAGAAIITGAYVINVYESYPDWVYDQAEIVMENICLLSGIVMMLTITGFVVTCCCTRKLKIPLYSIFCLSFALAMIALGFVGLINQSDYEDKTQDKMKEVFCRYNLTHHGEFESKIDSILSNNQCCGVNGFKDFTTPDDIPITNISAPTSAPPNYQPPSAILHIARNSFAQKKKKIIYPLPLGCCGIGVSANATIPPASCTSSNRTELFKVGCYHTLHEASHDLFKITTILTISYGFCMFPLIIADIFFVRDFKANLLK